MSILIKGLDMPKSCAGCIFDVWDSCLINSNIEPKNKLTHSCPLIELPDHGDLIDRDEIFTQLRKDFAIIERMASEARAMAKDYLDGEKCGMGKAMIRVYEHEAVIPAEMSEASLCICDNCDQRNDKGCSVCKYIINEGSEDGEN